MSLKDRDRTRPRRLVRLGIIRLGYKEKRQRKDGSEYEFPVQADHFVLTDAQELTQVYGKQPRELDVILPFPDVERNFDAAYTVWAGGVLVCRGDGEFVEYAAPFKVTTKKNGKTAVYNDAGDTQVSGGAAQVPFDWNGTHFEPGELVPCSGASQDLYPHCKACKMSAILKVMMADPRLFRLGYYQIATGSGRNYDTILGTLELIGDQAGKVNGIPFKLRLVEEQTTYQENGKRRKTTKWFLQLEPDPTFVRKLYSKTAAGILALPSGNGDGATEEAYEAEFVEAEEPAPPPFAEDGGPAEEPESEEEPQAPPENGNGASPGFPEKYGDFVSYVIEHTGYTSAMEVGDAIKASGVKSLVKQGGACGFDNVADVYSVLAAAKPK